MNRRIFLLGATALGACSVLPQQPYLQRRDWPLDVRRPTARPPRGRGPVLLVRRVLAGPGLDARGLQWLERDGSLHTDFYEQWAVPPAQAVEDDVRQWLTDSGLFRAVLSPGSRLNADIVLEGQLNTFSADLKTNTARVELALVVLDQRPSPIKVMLQKTETAQVPLAGTDPPAIVQAMKAALIQVLQQTERDLAALV